VSPQREREIREMYRLYEAGATLREVGDTYGISAERVRQQLRRGTASDAPYNCHTSRKLR
jgi:DNA-directed RNA polymerase sigma subunit (sigma70/sigma32)